MATGPRLHYAEYGDPDGAPVVFLHGWPDSWFSFSRVLPHLPEGLRAVAVDQRGFGDSDRPEAGYSIPGTGAGVITLLDHLMEYDDTQLLARTAAPRHVLWGDRDALFSRADQDRLLAALTAARSTVYEETGHCPTGSGRSRGRPIPQA